MLIYDEVLQLELAAAVPTPTSISDHVPAQLVANLQDHVGCTSLGWKN